MLTKILAIITPCISLSIEVSKQRTISNRKLFLKVQLWPSCRRHEKVEQAGRASKTSEVIVQSSFPGNTSRNSGANDLFAPEQTNERTKSISRSEERRKMKLEIFFYPSFSPDRISFFFFFLSTISTNVEEEESNIYCHRLFFCPQEIFLSFCFIPPDSRSPV